VALFYISIFKEFSIERISSYGKVGHESVFAKLEEA